MDPGRRRGGRRVVCIGSLPLRILVELDPDAKVISLPDLESVGRFLRTATGARLLIDMSGVAASEPMEGEPPTED